MRESRLIKVCMVLVLMLVPTVASGLGPMTLGGVTDASFGEITYTAASTGSVQMGTNGSITYTGAFSGPAAGTNGSFTITLPLVLGFGTQVEIGCDATGLMRKTSGSASLQITDVEFVVGSSNRTSFGGGRACINRDTASGGWITIIGILASRTVYVGMRVNMPTTPSADGAYSTANPGGNDILFQVVRH